MTSDSQPHDHLIRYLFHNLRHVASYLRSVLPQRLLDHLDLERLELVPSSFITNRFKEKRSDLLVYAPRNDLQSDAPGVFFYFLIEHQREPDHLMPVRLLGYNVGIWEGWLRGLSPKTRRGPIALPPVIPIVIYQGSRAWTVARDLAEMTNLDGLDQTTRQQLRPYLVNQRYLLHNLRETSDDHLGPRGTVRVALTIMKYIDSPNLADVLAGLIDDLEIAIDDPNTDLQDVRMILRYIMSASKHVTTEQLIEIVEPLGQKTQEVVMTEAQRLIQQGIEKGLQQGIEKGAQARSETIARALLLDGMAPEKVATVTGLSLQWVLALRED